VKPASAQFFRGGVLLGFNGCQVDGDNQSGYDKFGLMGGAYVFTPLNNHFDLQLEIEYMGKGAQSVSNPEGDYQTEFTINLQYIELPVLIRYNTLGKFGFEGGLGFGDLFASSETLTSGPTTQFAFKHFELSGILGFKYKLNDAFSVDARYSYSILSIGTTFTNTNAYISGLYNNLFSLALCYQFP
jgi:hypothetical protein